jgi:hypothetical protein
MPAEQLRGAKYNVKQQNCVKFLNGCRYAAYNFSVKRLGVPAILYVEQAFCILPQHSGKFAFSQRWVAEFH